MLVPAMSEQRFPKGWDQQQVEKLLAEQESMTEEEQVATDEAVIAKEERTMVSIPNQLLFAERKLLVNNNVVVTPQSVSLHLTGAKPRVLLGAGSTGRSIEVDTSYREAQQWMELFKSSGQSFHRYQTRFISDIKTVEKFSDSFPLFRGRFFRESARVSSSDFGPPPIEKAIVGRYNRAGQSRLYLCSSVSGVVRELGPAQPGDFLWSQEFRFPNDLRIFDARKLPESSFAASVFWVIEEECDRSAKYSGLGSNIVDLLDSEYEGMIVPGVRGSRSDRYSNIVIFNPFERWQNYLLPFASPNQIKPT